MERYTEEDIGSYVFLVKVPERDAKKAKDVLWDLGHILKADYVSEDGSEHVFVFSERIYAKEAEHDLYNVGFETEVDFG